ncbi:Multi antimicrobial extrusion protein (Na(+)/drug antiporter), MATE family of MDR efflux pump [Lachnospiraceae bacterium TWA4]|nr:Multi antimicrobial extrusion protein (Na(+)/drug antiporter), MATE family of MDR efflux pump [Lachnospiraceae bacterium TWA4]
MKLRIDLTKDPILKSLLLFAIPILISNIFQQLYNTADTMIVGHTLGDTSLAAIGACTAIYDLLIGFGLGVGNGLSLVVARSYGAGNQRLLKKSVACSLVIGLILSLGIMLISRIGLYPLLRLLNTPETIIRESYSYISTITLFVGVLFAYNLFSGLLNAIGNSYMPLVFLIISSILNIFLDFIFITSFHMGIRGTAIATVIAQGISAILCACYIFFKAHILVPTKEDFSFDKNLYAELLGQGLSMGFMMAIVSSGTVILQRSINGFGDLVIAGHTTARKAFAFCTMPLATFSMAMSTFVSQNRGANKRERILSAITIGHKFSILWAVIATILMVLFAKSIIGLVSGSSEDIVLTNGANYMIWNAPFFIPLGMLLNLRNSLQGLGQKIIPLISSIIELLGKIIFAWVFIPILGYFGVIICEPVIWTAMCMQLLYAFYTNPYIKGESCYA